MMVTSLTTEVVALVLRYWLPLKDKTGFPLAASVPTVGAFAPAICVTLYALPLSSFHWVTLPLWFMIPASASNQALNPEVTGKREGAELMVSVSVAEPVP